MNKEDEMINKIKQQKITSNQGIGKNKKMRLLNIKWMTLLSVASLSSGLHAAPIALESEPLFGSKTKAPLVMLILGKDHTLAAEAYDDTADLDDDGVINNRFTPTVEYAGYFNSKKCYKYKTSNDRFVPKENVGLSSPCINNDFWHGNFLNYLTMSRMDILRQSLYGGLRYIDSTNTVLERAFIPPDGHGWAKSYQHKSNGSGLDTYDISAFAPLEKNKKYLFANASFYGIKDQAPLLRVIRVKNSLEPWDWASENPMLKVRSNDEAPGKLKGANGINTSNPNLQDMVVRVKVCTEKEPGCKQYPNGSYKPTGLLHDNSELKKFQFGLITGSYGKNLSGGVLRNAMGNFLDTVDINTGKFTTTVGEKDGIAGTIDKLEITGFNMSDVGDGYGNYNASQPGQGDPLKNRNNADSSVKGECKHSKYKSQPLSQNGECTSWGNPIGEMLYESLRYFSGSGAPSTSYTPNNTMLGLPIDNTWADPFSGTNECAQAANVIISDINPSYDSDELPGSLFSGTYSGTILPGFSVQTYLDLIDSLENTSGKYLIGDSAGNNGTGDIYKKIPSPKTVTSLGNIRGLPSEPGKEGSYSSAAVAYYAKEEGILTATSGEEKNIPTISVAMSPPLPVIEIPMGTNTGKISIIPFAKFPSQAVDGKNWDIENFNDHAATSAIVDYYIDNPTDIGETGGDKETIYRVNFEEVEYGSDYDMDMIVTYTVIRDSDSQITVKVSANREFGGGGIVHAGYIISGVDSSNKVFLDVRSWDVRDQFKKENKALPEVNQVGRAAYYLDTPYSDKKDIRGLDNSTWRAGYKSDKLSVAHIHYEDQPNNKNKQLPLEQTRTFTYNASDDVSLLHSPLWYAAKYGDLKFDTQDSEKKEWQKTDKNGDVVKDKNGDPLPRNYFPVTDASQLNSQLSKAFAGLSQIEQKSSPPRYNATTLVSGASYYVTRFEDKYWTGTLQAYPVTNSGEVNVSAPTWDAAEKLLLNTNRKIFTSNGTDVFEFNSTNIDDFTTAQKNYLVGAAPDSNAAIDTDLLGTVISYIRADDKVTGLNVESDEGPSDPAYEVPNGFRFKPRSEKASALGAIINSAPYYIGPIGRFFGHNVVEKAIAFGANDGMVHIVSAVDGEELLAYLPSTVYGKEYGSGYQGLFEYTQEDWSYLPTVDGNINGFTGQDSKTTIIGSLGLHFKGLYGIDVSNLTSVSDNNILWEITPETTSIAPGITPPSPTPFADIGVTKLAPQGALLNVVDSATGKFTEAVIFTNGYNSGQQTGGNKNGILYFADLKTGAFLHAIDTGVAGDSAASNPLSAPALIDTDSNGTIDKIYVGDSVGNLWVFDTSAASFGDWDFATNLTDPGSNAPLFTAASSTGKAQPITSQPQVAIHPKGKKYGYVITFGTGRYATVNDNDVANQITQSLYVIHDNSNTAQSTALSIVRDSSSGDYPSPSSSGTTVIEGLVKVELAASTATSRDFKPTNLTWNSSTKGLYFDIEGLTGTNQGERVIVDSSIIQNNVYFMSFIPNSTACGGQGQSWLTVISLLDGSVKYVKRYEKGPVSPEGPFHTPTPDDPTIKPKVEVKVDGPEIITDGIKPPDDEDANAENGGKLNWRELIF